jgi:tetratricopeptide (TPR) repeat protein
VPDDGSGGIPGQVAAALKGYVPVREKAGLGMKDGKPFMYDSAFARKRRTALAPSFYILDSAGAVIDSFVSYHAAPELAARLTQARRDYCDFPELAKRIKERPGDHAVVGRYAAMLAARGRVAEAVAHVEKAERAGAGAALAPAYNRIADTYYQALFGGACELYGSFDDRDKGTVEAVRWFKRTVAMSRDPNLVAYARYGLATCYGAQGKRKEQDAEYDAILAMPDAPAMIKEWIEQRRPRGSRQR